MDTIAETSWHSYPSIFALGHRVLGDLFSDPVLIEEKVDGSQFSFGVFEGRPRVRSKGQEMHLDAPEKMFEKAVETVKEISLQLHPGWTYRAEYLQKPKHNTLAYDRTPERHIIIFDINPAHESYLPYDEKAAEAARIGLEVVPRLGTGIIESPADLLALLETTSVLGGQKIEGFVVKNYARFGHDKKALMGKFVSETFKEVHNGEWRKNNPTTSDFIDTIVAKYRTPARWAKAVQHLTEAGALERSPRDIGKLMKEVSTDVLNECYAEILQDLFRFAWPKVQRALTHGLPEWYKAQLLEAQFAPTEDVA